MQHLSNFTIIGLCGKQQVGKDTVADMIKLRWSPRVYVDSFSTPLKSILKEVFEVDLNALEANKQNMKVPGFSDLLVRNLMQGIVEGFRKHIREDIWICLMQKRILALQEPLPTIIIVRDVRYANEERFLRANNALIVKIVKENTPTQIGENHESEQHTIKADIVISNNSTRNDLYLQIIEKILPKIPKNHLTKPYQGFTQVPDETLKLYYQSGIINTYIESDYCVDVPDEIYKSFNVKTN